MDGVTREQRDLEPAAPNRLAIAGLSANQRDQLRDLLIALRDSRDASEAETCA